MGKKPHNKNVVSLGERCRIELLTLANHAEAVSGLLYLAGAGWTEHHRMLPPGAPMPASMIGVAAMVYIPWMETNREHKISFGVEDHDGKSIFTIEAKFTVGRPPTLSPGSGQHTPIALNMGVAFPSAGGYRLVARLNESGDVRTWSFRVHDQMAQQASGS